MFVYIYNNLIFVHTKESNCMETNHNEEYLPLKQMISSTPFDFSSSAFSMNPGTCCMLNKEKQQIKNIKSNVLIRQKSEIKLNEQQRKRKSLPACGSESTRDTEENDLLTSGESVNGGALKLIILVKEGDSSFWYNIADSNRSHGGEQRI